MNKRYALLVYKIYFDRWRVGALMLFGLSIALLSWSPPPLRDYRAMLLLAAGLGALVFILGFALASLAFVVVGKNGLVIQLPFWRVQVPFDSMKNTRTVALAQIAPGRWGDEELAATSALLIELNRWPQPRSVLKFWLGRIVLPSAIVVPVDDVIALRIEVDAGIAKAREARAEEKSDSWSRPFS